jgi:ABC-type transporter Mla subunit MlaD
MNLKSDATIAISVILAALFLGVTLLISMGKLQTPGSQRQIYVDFDRIDNIKPRVTEVKVAGVAVGRVADIHILTRAERQGLLDAGGKDRRIRITVEVPEDLELSKTTSATIRQASLMSEHFIELTTGPASEELLAEGQILEGAAPAGVGDLMAPGGVLLARLTDAAESLKATLDNARFITDNAKKLAPEMLGKLDDTLNGSKALMDDLGSEKSRENIRALLSNIRALSDETKVVATNLKVASTHAKLLTATLAQRPWRVLFGGKPNTLPSEEEIIKSSKALLVKPAEGGGEPADERPAKTR